MAKADTLGKQPLRDGTGTSIKDYTSLLGVVAAGILGMSLLCITSAIALSAPNQPTSIVLEPGNIVDLAVNNINTVSALTVQALSTISFEETPILLPSRTPTSSPTVTSSPVIIPPTQIIQRQPTRTRAPRIPPTSTPRPLPTRTRTPLPTRTRTPLPPPTLTNTPPPPPTFTNTPLPPPDTFTPEPPPDTFTPEPPPDTFTPEPPPVTPETATPGAVEPIVNNTPTAGTP